MMSSSTSVFIADKAQLAGLPDLLIRCISRQYFVENNCFFPGEMQPGPCETSKCFRYGGSAHLSSMITAIDDRHFPTGKVNHSGPGGHENRGKVRFQHLMRRIRDGGGRPGIYIAYQKLRQPFAFWSLKARLRYVRPARALAEEMRSRDAHASLFKASVSKSGSYFLRVPAAFFKEVQLQGAALLGHPSVTASTRFWFSRKSSQMAG
jgi:hypothetical protein